MTSDNPLDFILQTAKYALGEREPDLVLIPYQPLSYNEAFRLEFANMKLSRYISGVEGITVISKIKITMITFIIRISY